MAATHDPHPVTRTLTVSGMVCEGCARIVVEGVEGLTGAGSVAADWRRNRVTVTYDLKRVRIQEVEKLLADIGYPPAQGFFQRQRRRLLHFAEQNERDNLKHVGHCCSKPPPGA